jgi:very-short-patch-repair endonuclease
VLEAVAVAEDIFGLDFYCPKLKLAIEVDGPSHDGPEAEAYDRFRQRDIESLGIQFLRFPNAEVYRELDAVVEAIQQRVRELRQSDRS